MWVNPRSPNAQVDIPRLDYMYEPRVAAMRQIKRTMLCALGAQNTYFRDEGVAKTRAAAKDVYIRPTVAGDLQGGRGAAFPAYAR